MSELLEEKIKNYGFESQTEYLECLQKFYAGIQDFLHYPYAPYINHNPVIWQNGSSKLIDFGLPDKLYDKIILFIPSFINKSYILDLTEQRSLLKFCASSNHRPVLLDWGSPTEAEQNYDCAAYIINKVMPAIAHLRQSGKEVVLAGYCLGGLVAVATAQLMPNDVHGLILLATPWDFTHFQEKTIALQHGIDMALSCQRSIPSANLRYFFYSFLPQEKIYGKFIKFSQSLGDKQKSELFVAVERWAMDDMLIAKGVFNECALDFISLNKPLNNQWQVADQIINPSAIKIKSLIVAPTKDTIVPYNSVTALINLLPKSNVILPDSGHVGMIIGEKAEKQLWQPMLVWLES